MDFLDSIDLKYQEKSKRVRSWYLYEQFKALERNQLDAAQRLKERSYQDRILQQELSERRARRTLYDQHGVTRSESRIAEKSVSDSNKTTFSASTDDFFESLCELPDDEGSGSEGGHREADPEDAFSQEDSQTEKLCLDEYKSLEDIKDDQMSFADSVNSVILNGKQDDFAEELREELNYVTTSIAEGITQQFETVKENIHCLERYSKLCSEDKISEVESSETVEEQTFTKSLSRKKESDINLYNIWIKLVSFAYQVMQLNHGNCYYDYSSQFLTGVLACDVIRRGVNRMCHILQPYVSPIKLSTDESDSSTTSYKNIKRKKKPYSKKSRKSTVTRQKYFQCECHKRCKVRSRHLPDDCWRKLSVHRFGFGPSVESRGGSAPLRSAKRSSCLSGLSEMSSRTVWPTFSNNLSDECSCQAKVKNPMLKIGHYIDKLLSDIDGC